MLPAAWPALGSKAQRHAVERPLTYDTVGTSGKTRSAKSAHVGPATESELQEKFVLLALDAVRASGDQGATVEEVEAWCGRNYARYGIEPRAFNARFRGKQLLTRVLPGRGLVAKVAARNQSSGSAARYALILAFA